MSDLSAVLVLLVTFVGLLLALVWLSRAISGEIQFLVYQLTRNKDAPTLAIFLIFLPGVIIHEAAHWFTARLIGLKTGKFRVWPKRQGRHIGLGSVSVQSLNPVTDSLVGIAPLVTGSILVALIGNYIFNAYSVAGTLAQGRLLEGFRTYWSALGTPDGAVWAYLLFAVANAMMPSASDREPLRPVLIYAGCAAGLYVLLGMPLQGVAAFMVWITPALQIFTAGLFFVAVLDIAILAVLVLIRLFILR